MAPAGKDSFIKYENNALACCREEASERVISAVLYSLRVRTSMNERRSAGLPQFRIEVYERRGR